MLPTLGKRRRGDHMDDDGENPGLAADDTNTSHTQALFQQHFESTFKPLEGQTLQAKTSIAKESAECLTISESDWDGFSENEDEKPAVVVQHSTHRPSRADVLTEELKTFMTAKPPSTNGKTGVAIKKKQSITTSPDAVETDTDDLKKDLALQRLLKESHLLDPQSSLSHSGQNRHKALDLRLQGMGFKGSIFVQQKMPLAQRKGIISKSAEREASRRRQAQENGIILERASRGKDRDSSKRQRGIGAPAIGKFQGGMLTLSKKDVANIEGPKKGLQGRR